jgi:signal transduction histidine kinase/CheY-like chemotaxis protein
MKKNIKKIWDNILYFGINSKMKNETAKKAVQMNIIGIITFFSFHLFFFILISLAKGNKKTIILTYFIILLAILSFSAAKLKRKLLTKILLITNAYLGIFFFDVYLGSSVGMGVYYFPFLFVAIKVFSFKRERLLLLLFIFLPLVLYILTGTIFKQYYDRSILSSENIQNLRTFNFTFSFFLVVLYANYIVNYEIKNDTILANASLSLQTLIDNTNGSLWSINNNCEIITANDSYVKSMKNNFQIKIEAGYDLKNIINSKAYPIEWLGFINNVLKGNSFIKEYEINGNIHEIQAAPIIKDNIIIGAVFHDTNINTRKQYDKNIALANEELQKALKSKEQFLSNMSHELRTPLNGIIGISNLLLSEESIPSQNENLDMLKYSADHMLDIVNDILDYNKIDAKKLELESSPFNIETLVNKVAIFFNQQAINKNISLIIDTKSIKNIIINGDALRLRQVLNNLLSNAIKFTNTGIVSLNVSKIKSNDEGTVKLKFSVTDTGIGIPGNKLDLIFSSFGQADSRITKKFGGTGLGLTISARLVELMDGKINVESIHGKGSKFWFELDFPYSTKDNILDKSTSELKSLKGIKALIAEDNKVNLMVIKKFLENWGITTESAENGSIAVEKAHNTKFDFILMDLEMPIMDGKTAVKNIRTFDKNIPIIAITASTGENLKKDLLNLGMNDYIPKPFVPEDLHHTISSLLDK